MNFLFLDPQTLKTIQLAIPSKRSLTWFPFILFLPEPWGDQEWQYPVSQHCPSNVPLGPALLLTAPPRCPFQSVGPQPQVCRPWHQASRAPPSGHLPPFCPASSFQFHSHPGQDLEAERLLGGLQSASHEGRREALKHLVLLASDMTFAQEVISRDGLQRLGTIIEDGDE